MRFLGAFGNDRNKQGGVLFDGLLHFVDFVGITIPNSWVHLFEPAVDFIYAFDVESERHDELEVAESLALVKKLDLTRFENFGALSEFFL